MEDVATLGISPAMLKKIYSNARRLVRLLRNQGKIAINQYQKGNYCPYNEFSRFRVEVWEKPE